MILQVLQVDNTTVGNLLLIGQVADAIGTPFFGYESDRSNGFLNYGKRKSWHLFGEFRASDIPRYICFPSYFVN